ncbi:MAG: AraC family transcriptional regulator, partial [Parvularcula sp.]|nr:AraC family transcriptional regulator [Parvularcula sp.]
MQTGEGNSAGMTGAKTFLTSDKPAIPMHYPGFILRTLCKDGHAAEDLLAGTGLTADQFVDPYFRAPFDSGKRFVINVLEQTGDPHIGLRIARVFEAHIMGLPAYTAMNAATFRDALEILNRFFSMTFPAMELRFPSEAGGLGDGELAIRLRPRFPVDEISYFASCSALIVCHQLLKGILRERIVASRFETYVSEPDDWAVVAPDFDPIPVLFDAPENRLIFKGEFLDRPLPGADPLN